MADSRRRLQEGCGEIQGGVLLLGRAWPQRAYLYASLREEGVDVYGVEHPREAREAVRLWPGRFGQFLFDLAGYSASEVAAGLALCGDPGLLGLLLAGPFERSGLPHPLPPRARVLEKPVSVGEVVRRVLTLCRRETVAGRGESC